MKEGLRKGLRAALWVLQLAMAVAMVGPGVQKFTGPTWERMFRAWGYPEGFYLVIGAIEVVGGILLLVPKVASAAAVVLMTVMIGAAVTQMRSGRDGIGEIVFCAALAVIAYGRWPGILRWPTAAANAQRTHGSRVQ